MGYVILKDGDELALQFLSDESLRRLNVEIVKELKKREVAKSFTEEVEYVDEDRVAAPSISEEHLGNEKTNEYEEMEKE